VKVKFGQLIFVLVVLLIAGRAQQPGKPGKSADTKPPVLPFVTQPACPFECCQFGEWTARRRAVIYSDWRANKRRKIGVVAIGQRVTAIDGAEVIFQPEHLQVLAVVDEIRAKPGDTILRFAYYGEGRYDYWFDGRWIREYEGAFALACSDPEHKQYRFCSAEKDRRQWWAKVKTKTGLVGWVYMNSLYGNVREGDISPFEGTDACGR
jgi:hypothetical protein